MKKIIALAAVFFVYLSSDVFSQTIDDAQKTLDKVKSGILYEFRSIDSNLNISAKELSKTGLKGKEARKTLNKLYNNLHYAYDCATIDLKGTMVTVVPESFRKFEGTDISYQQQVKTILRTKRPVFSTVFRSVEGFDAVDFKYPVFDKNNSFLGSVSILIKPENMLDKIIQPLMKKSKIDIWVMQKNGLNLYDVDAYEIGKNVFSDNYYKPYPNLLYVFRKISQSQSGIDSFDMLDTASNKLIKRDVIWDTVEIFGNEWKIIGYIIKSEEAPSLEFLSDEDKIIKNEVQTAVSLLAAVYKKALTNEIPLVEAKKLGAELLRNLRYGDNKEGYFFADTKDGVNVVLYGDKNVEGTNRIDANINGIFYVREIITKGLSPQGGYTNYWFPKKGETKPSKKRSYSLYYEPFDWIVGTGYYLDNK